MSKSDTPRKRRAARTRQAILDAARDMISEQGIHNVSLRAIARRVDYSPAGLYEYFGSKEEIVAAVVEDGFVRFARYLNSVPQELAPLDYLKQLGIAYLHFADQNPQHFMLIFNTLGLYQNRSDFISHSTFHTLTTALQRGIDSGDIRTERPLLELAYAGWSLVHGMATLRLTHLASDTTDWQTASEQVLEMWYAGLK
ncbi:MAG: TetR/AcrR family transcriptional regulator [Chloroflexota bacterium]